MGALHSHQLFLLLPPTGVGGVLTGKNDLPPLYKILEKVSNFMPVERSAGIILFLNTPRGREYLVIRSSREDKTRPEFWDFPKGVLDPGEKGIDAARREAKEEVGFEDFEMISDFKETVHYFTRREGEPVPKYVAMFLAQARTDDVRLSWEHDKYEWLPYDRAHQLISLPQMKSALKSAEEYLCSISSV